MGCPSENRLSYLSLELIDPSTCSRARGISNRMEELLDGGRELAQRLEDHEIEGSRRLVTQPHHQAIRSLIRSSYPSSAANAPYSNVSRYVPQHCIVSPGFTSSGSVVISSQAGQLTR
jgi:hypothetical protein